MKRKLLPIIAALAALAALVALAGCGSRASVVANNLSTEADNFQVARVVTFYNGITGQDVLVIKGLCSIGQSNSQGSSQDAPSNGDTLTVTCKVGPNSYIKDFLGLANNVTYVVQQIAGQTVSDTHYLVIWRPGTLIPGISVQ